MEDEIVGAKVHQTAVVLANIAELGATIVRKVAGNDIVLAIDGETLTKDAVRNMVIATAVSEIADGSKIEAL